MQKPLEDGLENAYWGYIFIDRNGNFKHRLRNSSYPIVAGLNSIKEAFLTSAEIFFSPRSLLPYQGMISWHHLGEEVCLYGMKTHKRTTIREIKKLYEEFESLAKSKGVEYITTLTAKKLWGKSLSQNVMTRLGWELVEKGNWHSCYKYRKKIQ